MITDTDLDRMLRSLLRKPAATPTGGLRRALAEVATTPQQRHRWLRRPAWLDFGHTSSLTRFAVAAVVVALFGGFLLVAQPMDQRRTSAPGAAATMSAQPSEGDCRPLEEMEEEASLVPGCEYFVDFGDIRVPTSGWVYRRGFWPEVMLGWSLVKGDAEVIFYRNSTPDGTYADPCGQVRGEPIAVRADEGDAILQHSADLVAAMAAIPGIEVIEGPSEVVEPDGWRDTRTGGTPRGGLPVNHVAIRIPEGSCLPFSLWWDSDLGARRATEPNATIRIWVYDHPYIIRRGSPPWRIWIEAETPADADPDLDREIQQIIDSIGTPG